MKTSDSNTAMSDKYIITIHPDMNREDAIAAVNGLYKHYFITSVEPYDSTTDRDSMVEKCVEAVAKQFAIDYSYDAKICVWKGPYTESIRTALRTVLNPEG